MRPSWGPHIIIWIKHLSPTKLGKPLLRAATLSLILTRRIMDETQNRAEAGANKITYVANKF
jgi:hypothetical protein